MHSSKEHTKLSPATLTKPKLLKKRANLQKSQAVQKNTRSLKKQKIEEKQKEIDKIKYECRTNNLGLVDLETDLDEINKQGASCLKYEIIKKGNKKVMLAKRCSKRNAPIGFGENGNDISKDTSFEYCPNQLENLFDQDENAKKMQTSAIKKKLIINQDDIDDVIGALDSENKIILIKTKSQKFKTLCVNK